MAYVTFCIFSSRIIWNFSRDFSLVLIFSPAAWNFQAQYILRDATNIRIVSSKIRCCLTEAVAKLTKAWWNQNQPWKKIQRKRISEFLHRKPQRAWPFFLDVDIIVALVFFELSLWAYFKFANEKF